MNAPAFVPMTYTFRGYRSDPIPNGASAQEKEDALAQAIARWLRSRSRFGRLLNRLRRVQPVAESRPMLRLVESADQSDPVRPDDLAGRSTGSSGWPTP